MRSTRIMCGRRSKGVSTILGTLIFIGILFTSVIPMMLVMKQADTVYTQTVHEMEAADQERENEAAEAYAFPVNDSSPELKVRVNNIGVVPVKVVRVWINDDMFSCEMTITSQETKVIGPFEIEKVDGAYVVKVATERGNCFSSTAGTLYLQDGYWFTPSLGIHVLVLNWFGKYNIYVYNTTWSTPEPEVYWTQGIDIGDIEWTQIVDSPGNYWVVVKKKQGGDWNHVPGSPIPVVINWPGGSPVINVIADGRGF